MARVRWSHAHTEALAFLAACTLLGGCMGLLIALLRPGEGVAP